MVEYINLIKCEATLAIDTLRDESIFPTVRDIELMMGSDAIVDSWSGHSAKAIDGNFYFAPSSATRILCFNQELKKATLVGPEIDCGQDRYSSAVADGQGNVYFIPYDAERVLCFGKDGVVRAFGDEIGSNIRKWNSGVLAADGRIYCPPNHAAGVLCIDPMSGRTDVIMSGPEIPLTDGKWVSCALAADGKIYCAPCHFSRVLCIDPVAGTAYQVGEDLGNQRDKFGGACVSADGERVFFAPRSTRKVLSVDVRSQSTRLIDLPLEVVSAAADPTSLLFEHAALGEDGHVYLFPCLNLHASSAMVVALDTCTDLAEPVGATSLHSGGSFLADDGYIYSLASRSHWIRTDSRRRQPAIPSGSLAESLVTQRVDMKELFLRNPCSVLRLFCERDCTYHTDISDWLSFLGSTADGIAYLNSCTTEVSTRQPENMIESIIRTKSESARNSLLRMPLLWRLLKESTAKLLQDDASLLRKLALSDREGLATDFLLRSNSELQIALDSFQTLVAAVVQRSPTISRLITRGISINKAACSAALRETAGCPWLSVALLDWCEASLRAVFASDIASRAQGFSALLRDVYGTKRVTEFVGEEFMGTELWHGAATGLDGKVYCCPRNAAHVLCIDPYTQTARKFGESVAGFDGGPSDMMWIGAASGGDGRIFCAPFNALRVLCIDPKNQTVGTIGDDLSQFGLNKWATAVCGVDGNVYCLPFDAPCVLCINPFTEKITTLGTNLVGPDHRFVGACVDNVGNIFGFPMFGTRVCCVDPVAGSFAFVCDAVGEGGEGKWAKPVLGWDNALYACPGGMNRALRMDPTARTLSMVGTDYGFVGWKWHDNVAGADNHIYGLPVTASRVLKLDISSKLSSFVGSDVIVSGGSGVPWGWMSGSLAPDGCIYCAPSRGKVLRIDTAPPLKRICDFLSGRVTLFPGGKLSVDAFKELLTITHSVSSEILSSVIQAHGTIVVERLLAVVSLNELRLLTESSSWVRQKNDAGLLPIHIALQSKAPANVVLFFLKSYPDAVRERDNEGRLPLDYALKEGMSEEVIKVLLFSDLPYASDGTEARHSFSWTNFLRYDESFSIDLYHRVFESIFRSHPLCFHKFASAKDQHGAVAYDFVKPSLRTIFNFFLLWHGRYRVVELRPEHTSATCLVFKSLDETTYDEEGNPLRVALKLMFDKSQFVREVNARAVGFSKDRVMSVLRTHPESANADICNSLPDIVDVGVVMDGLLSKTQVEQLYCIVMPWADRNLFVSLKQDRFAGGQNLEEVRNIFRQLVEAVQHMHFKGFLHADLKPLNIVRVGATWKLIDLDAAARIGVEYVGAKFSSAYLPPEGITVDVAEGTARVREASGDNRLLAHPSVDVWSLGCILYQFVNEMAIPLFQASLDDNLVDDENEQDSLFTLAHWNDSVKTKKLLKIADGQARNLVAQMLSRDPQKRPSLERVLKHPFLSKKQVVRMVGEEAQFKVFLSYRVASDFANASKLYDMLTDSGVSVWWDKKCLKNGEEWEDGFCSGLLNSDNFVCLLSRGAVNASGNPRQDLSLLTPDSNCDNVLLEHQLALELFHIGTIRHIFPIFIGDEIPVQGREEHSDYFSSGCHPKAPSVCVRAVQHKLTEHMEKMALGSPHFPDRTVADVCRAVTACQGAFIKGERETAFQIAVENIVIMCKESEADDTSSTEDVLRAAISERDTVITELREKLEASEKEISEFRANLSRIKYIPFFP